LRIRGVRAQCGHILSMGDTWGPSVPLGVFDVVLPASNLPVGHREELPQSGGLLPGVVGVVR
jgi:hypothetical protein